VNYAPLLSNFFYAPMSLSLCKNLSKTKKVERLKPLISLPGILMIVVKGSPSKDFYVN
jgi:hypothetical protein